MVGFSSEIGHEMTGSEARSLLNSQGHGVLSMGTDDRGYGIPMSYAFDDAGPHLVMEFVNSSDSKKQEFAEATSEVTLTVYNYENAKRWESVIVTGTLQSVSKEHVADQLASLFFSQADDAAGDLRWIDLDDLDRVWYKIDITEITGRHSGVLPHDDS